MHVYSHTRFSDQDIYLFRMGQHVELHRHFGAHLITHGGVDGCYFAVYAPAAKTVYVIGDFNDWTAYQHALYGRTDKSGIWEGFIPFVTKGQKYKYIIIGQDNKRYEKADPYARLHETPPQKASIVWDAYYPWQDTDWMTNRHLYNALEAPWSIYEVHIESWKKHQDRSYPLYSYKDLATSLIPYVTDLGFTHIEFMPIAEYPYDKSWGYQTTGYFAPTSRFGTPEDLKYLIDQCHQAGIGVILDWVPSHFPGDPHGLALFDGSCVYEHPDHQKGFHQDWHSYIFNYENNQVRSFLLSSGLFWFSDFHIDGIRVDAVSSMIHLDYSRAAGQWSPNIYGGREYLEAISFLQSFNKYVYDRFPNVQTIAEESTDHQGVTHPIYEGGLGFGMKWMMGWMHDTLEYFSEDPLFRKHKHERLTFSMMYAYSERFVLALSHDEVVHGKGPLIYKMPGTQEDKIKHLACLYCYMWTHPGAKLLFMGGEFAQTSEWNYATTLDWHLMNYAMHSGIHALIKKLNQLYRSLDALHSNDYKPEGFRWCLVDQSDEAIIAYQRMADTPEKNVLVIINLTPVHRPQYKIPLQADTKWTIRLHTAAYTHPTFKPSTSQIYMSYKSDDVYYLKIDLVGLSGIIMTSAQQGTKSHL